MVSVEGITVFAWGPLCYIIAICIAWGSSLRYPLQIVVSLAHLYGVALYFSTNYYEEMYRGLSYSRPEPLYYWVYYIGFNAPWVVVPTSTFCSSLLNMRKLLMQGGEEVILISSIWHVRRVFRSYEKMNAQLRLNAMAANAYKTREAQNAEVTSKLIARKMKQLENLNVPKGTK